MSTSADPSLLQIAMKTIKDEFSWQEVCLFLVVSSIIVILGMLIHNTVIQKQVTKSSRCLREKQNGRTSGIYSILAKNEKNEPLYKVNYNLASREYDVECACNKGEVLNHFRQIKVYDMKDISGNPTKTIEDKRCYCENLAEPARTYYTGYPDLIRYMNENDTSFFLKSM